MRIRSIVLSFLLVAPSVIPAAAADQARPGSRLALLYDSLANPVPDPDRAAEVSGILLIRGGQEILLTKGTLRLFRPVAGTVFGAVFTGEGLFTYYIPTESEREEFTRQSELELADGRYVWKFSRAVFWFQDTLLHELGGGLEFTRRDVAREEDDIVERSRRYLTEPASSVHLYDLAVEIIERPKEPFLFAHFAMPDKKEVFLEYNPRRHEEVVLYRPPIEAWAGGVWWTTMLNSFHLLDEYAAQTEYSLTAEEKRRFDWLSNTVGLTVEKSGEVAGRATVRIRERSPGERLLRFDLAPDLVIDSVSFPSGEPAEYHRREDSWSGIVHLPEPSDSGWTLVFSYHGDYLRVYDSGIRVVGMFFMPRSGGTTGWYPASGEMDRMNFDVTYDVPGDLTVVGAGKVLLDSVAGGRRITRFATSGPDLINSFTLGEFTSESFQLSDTEIVVTVYDLGSGRSEHVGKDCANSFRLFTHLFGPPPFRTLRVTEGPGTHGQAFEEFLHLPWLEEFVGKKGSAIAIGRAHEVSHSWWGYGVGWSSYHDQWISEAFAHYSALLYAPFVLGKDDEFLEKLRNWKERINGARKYSLGSGARLGSIWLGYRVESVETQNDYMLSTYMKGAWVLHMIRMMLFNLDTGSEDSFLRMMREFYDTYRGKDPSTQDFIRLVSKYCGGDMTWFFDQWIYGTQIPTLKCERRITPTASGKYNLTVTISQKEVPRPFILYLPFELRYPDGSFARGRLRVDKGVQEFGFDLERQPADVKFNILESLLCPVEE